MWMSHGDKLHKVPDGFKAVGKDVDVKSSNYKCNSHITLTNNAVRSSYSRNI